MTETMDMSDPARLQEKLYALGMRQTLQEDTTINLIASDNAYPLAWTADPPYTRHIIQEGIAGDRPFAGARYHDEVEMLGAGIAKAIFGADHANLQPHSCSQANQAVYHALLGKRARILSLGFAAGGHLTHGLKANFSGRFYNCRFFGLGPDERIDYDALEVAAAEHKPDLIVCGSSAYPRLYDERRLRAVSDGCGARLMLDLSHEAGLIAGGAIPNPVPYADVVTMSLDKTLRGPFGAMILCRGELKSAIDMAVHPGTQSSFSVRRIFDSVNALIHTLTPEFRTYAAGCVNNARSLVVPWLEAGMHAVSGGTDKHYAILDLSSAGYEKGIDAEAALECIGVLTNRQTIPGDVSARMSNARGLRIGSPWITSRGFLASDAEEIGRIICGVLLNRMPPERAAATVAGILAREREGDVWKSKPAVIDRCDFSKIGTSS